MSDNAADAIESYVARLRAELTAAGATDADDLASEVRSMLTEAAADDATAAVREIERLGDPAELARTILAERAPSGEGGMPPGVWWRLGVAATIDLVVGVVVPLVAAMPLLAFAARAQSRLVGVTVAVMLELVALAWPLFIWRPWRRGGRTLSPGMTLTGLAVLRGPGGWRLVRIGELRAMGLTPRRHMVLAALLALAALLLIAVVIGALIWGGAVVF
jgi:hypothetical protein